jgi:hypothetical protein
VPNPTLISHHLSVVYYFGYKQQNNDMNKRLQELIQVIQSGETSEEVIKQYMVRYIVQLPDVIPTVLEILETERAENKQLRADMNMRLTFTTLAARQEPIDKNQLQFQLEENHKFYTEYQDSIRTAGIHLYPELP